MIFCSPSVIETWINSSPSCNEITLTHNGYIKRLPTSDFKAQRRGGRGVQGMIETWINSSPSCNEIAFNPFFLILPNSVTEVRLGSIRSFTKNYWRSKSALAMSAGLNLWSAKSWALKMKTWSKKKMSWSLWRITIFSNITALRVTDDVDDRIDMV